jgi:hypothetical protein
MNLELLREFEQALRGRNPLLVGKLQAGLPALEVERTLMRAKIAGSIEPLVTLYSWKNGGTLDLELRQSGKGLFPGKPFYFPALEMAVGHFGHFAAVAKKYTEISEAVGRYFPFFWDGSNSWFGIELELAHRNRVMMIELKSNPPFRQAYPSLEALITDGIRANRENQPLRSG